MPEADDAQRVADWIELELAIERESISKAWLTSILEQSGGESTEQFLSDIWRVLDDRARRYRHPRFTVDSNLVYRIESTEPIEPYVACLLFSLYSINQKRNDPKLFERLIAICLSEYLGGKSYVFGWPVLEDIPANIESRIKDVCIKIREKFAEAPQARYKDRGVDVISWKPFFENAAEHRSNQIVVLSQCAIGGDWRSKTGQIPLDSWKQYVHWANQPIKAFAVPIVIHDDLWHDISTEAGLLFDRIRIVNYVPQQFPDEPLMNQIKVWIDSEIENAKLQ
ncbi:MAG TPA: hypothetical protein VIN11_08465 [Roseivirga sp.]